MSGACQGWADWGQYKEAGVVDEHIDFSDNKVVVDNVLGRTRDTIGECFAIDAAVSYTLSKAGPDANLTVQDMVNEYTRTAAAMMNGRVGWGYVYKTGHLDGKHYTSCGHDEIEAQMVYLQGPLHDEENNTLTIDTTGWRSGGKMTAFLDENRAPDNIKALARIRLDDGQYSGLRLVDVIMSEHMKPLRVFIENHFDCKSWKLGEASLDYDGDIRESWKDLTNHVSIHTTYGKCAWDVDGSRRYCTYHDADKQTSKGWWMVSTKNDHKQFMKIWNGSRCSTYWNSNMFNGEGRWYHGRQVIRWSDVRRGIANSIDEAEVKRQIKKALNRMTKRRDNIVMLTNGEMGDGAPEDRTYRWKDWSWLAVIQAAVAQTSKKNRKEGDVVNGWKYTKTSTKRSYGHEIAEFEWQADGDVKTYSVSVKPSTDSYYTSTNSLPFRFKTLEEAVKFNKMLAMIATKAGAIAKNRQWDSVAGCDAPVDCSTLVVKSVNHGEDMKMRMEKDPEDLPSPTSIVQKVFWGLPNEYDTAVEHLDDKPFKKYKVEIIETEVVA